MRRSVFPAIVVGLLFVAPTAAQGDGLRPLATVVTIENGVTSGRLIQLAPDGAVLDSDGGGTVHVPVRDILRLEFGSPVTPPPAGPFVLLANGDRLLVLVQRLENESLVCRWTGFPSLPSVSIPLETVQGVAIEPPRQPGALRQLVRELRDGEFESDVLILRHGDRLTGELREVTEAECRLESAVGSVPVERSRIAGIGFNSSLISLPPVAPGRALVWLTDGSRITLREAALGDDGLIRGTTVFAAPLNMPLAAVRAIDVFGERVTCLSDLEPQREETRLYLALPSPLLRDCNVRGGDLRVRGVEYATGLGMSSGAAVTYRLDGKYRQFRATVGIDDQADGGGSVIFAIDLDGRRAWTSPVLTGRDEPCDVGSLDVSAAAEITLSVEFAEHGNIRDIADWCHPLLIR